MKSRRDFLRIQQKGRKYRSPHFILSLIPAQSESTRGRLGITVTTKVHKHAVKRNLLKRRVRELYRNFCQTPQYGADVVVIALTGSADLDFERTREEILFLFERAKVIRNSEGRSEDGAKPPSKARGARSTK